MAKRKLFLSRALLWTSRSSTGNLSPPTLVIPDVRTARTAREAERELDLARRAASGEAPAWDELIRLHGRRIYNVACSFARDAGEAEDLTQEVFLKLYRNLHRYRGDVPLAAWALTLSRNLCIEQYRRTRLERRSTWAPEEALESVASHDDPRDRAEHRQRLRTVHEALAGMSQELATAVLLRDLQGLSYEDVATFLEVPMGTLKSRLVRGRRELAERVARLSEPPAPGDGAGAMVGAEPC